MRCECHWGEIVFGHVLCVVKNSTGVSMTLVSLFWICGSIVIPYVYSLFKYFWDFFFALPVRLV